LIFINLNFCILIVTNPHQFEIIIGYHFVILHLYYDFV